MKITKQCILFLLILCVLIPNTAFAAGTETTATGEASMRDQIIPELNYLDKVYQYDVSEEDKVQAEEPLNTSLVTTVKASRYPVAIGTVIGLGIMSLTEDGTFDEDSLVPYNEYSAIVLRLLVGSPNAYHEEMHSATDQTAPTTHEQAMVGIMDGLGYTDVCEKTSYLKMATTIGLLKQFSYSSEKNITRGELARLLYNALTVDRMIPFSYNASGKYDIERGSTLLWDIHKAVKVEGVVTAAEGVDIYSTVMPGSRYISIDRVEYLKGDVDDAGLLGQQVFGYAVCDEDNRYTMIYLDYHQHNETVTIPITNIRDISNKEICYATEDGEQQKSLQNVKRVLYNNDIVDDYTLAESILEKEGDITICTLKEGFDALIINVYESFVASSIQSIKETITLKFSMTYAGSRTINVKEEKGKKITLIKNGETVGLSDISSGDVVSVMSNRAGTVVKVIVSDKIIKNGVVSKVSKDEVTIGKKTYKISEHYKTVRKYNPSLPVISAGSFGNFILTHDDRIVDFTATKGNKFAIMRGVKSRGVFGSDDDVQIRVFSEDGTWDIYTLASTLEFDGVLKCKSSEVYQMLSSTEYANAGVFDNMIQYKLNADDEVIMLDTMYDSDAEISSADTSRLLYNGLWEGELDWTVSTRLATLEGSRYKLMKDTVVFSVPNDLAAEKKYAAIKVSQLPADTIARVKIYSSDEYFRAGAVIENHTGSGAEERFYRMVVDEVVTKLDNEGEVITAVSALMLNVSGEPMAVEYTLSEDSQALASTLKRGDVLVHTFLGDNTINCRVLVDSSLEGWVDKINNPAGADEEMWGTVYSMDYDSDFLAVKVGDEIFSYEFEGAILYDREKDKISGASLEELCEGDKVYNRGSNSRARLVVYR